MLTELEWSEAERIKLSLSCQRLENERDALRQKLEALERDLINAKAGEIRHEARTFTADSV